MVGKLPFIENIICSYRLNPILPQVRNDLSPVMGKMVGNLKQYLFDGILILNPGRCGIGNYRFQFGILKYLFGFIVVPVIQYLAFSQCMDVIHAKGIFFNNPGIPNLMRIYAM